MDWLGLVVGVGGLVAGIFGLRFAFLAHQSAKSARSAAISAEDAANSARYEARRAITHTLSIVDIERAKSLIERLKGIHHRRNWDYALGQYPELRGILSDIVASAPENFALHVDSINSEIPRVTALEVWPETPILPKPSFS